MRIVGVDLPQNERIETGLTRIFGIGRLSSQKILKGAGVGLDKKVKDLTDDEAVRIRTIIDKDYKIEGDLRREVAINIRRLMDIGCYRGLRHKVKLPVRGQRTRTNARTRKGPRKAIIAPRKVEA